MKKDNHISEEQLNAFIDGELDPEERSAMFSAAEQSPELDQRLCQQRKLKEFMQHAYQDVPEPNRLESRKHGQKNWYRLALSATVFLLIGVTVGVFFGHSLYQGPVSQPQLANTSMQTGIGHENYILHVVSGDPVKMKGALEKARELLSSAKPGYPRQVEVVANDKGLNLLRLDTTPFASEIRALANDNVVFYACSRAIRLLEAKGIEIHLVPEANSDFTALDRVVMRMKDQWQYIKI